MSLPPEAEQFRGQRWEIKRFYADSPAGEDTALLLLHKWFEGNGAAASDFLGFNDSSRRVVNQAWAKLGLATLGNERPRRGSNANPGWPQRTTEELEAQYIALSQQHEVALEYVWEVPENMRRVKLLPVADVHVGHIGCDFARFVELCKWIKAHKFCRWFGAGDTFDLHMKDAPGNTAERFCSVDEALDLLTTKLEPIRDQCIGIGKGNHEDRLLNKQDVGWNPASELAKRLDVPYLDIAGHMVLRIGEQTYTQYYHHGIGAARTEGGKLNAGLSVLRTVTSEVVVMGHLHYEITGRDQRRDVDLATLEVGDSVQRIILCPSFLKYRGYPVAKAYKPSSLGVSTVEFGIKTHDIRVIE